jgi:hypothetical protein
MLADWTQCRSLLESGSRNSVGAVHGAYVSSREGSFGEMLFGWDSTSACWYFVSPPLIRGRAPDGRAFQGEPGKPFFFAPDDGSSALDGRLFAPLRKQLLTSDGQGLTCSSHPDGGVTISWQSPLGLFPPSPAQQAAPASDSLPLVTVTLVIDAQGRLVSRTLDSPGQPPAVLEFTYPPHQQAGFEAPDSLQGFRLASYEFDPTGNLDRFDPVSVNSLAMSSALNIQRGLAADARKKMDSQAATTANPISSYVRGQGGHLVPIIGTGLVLIIVGILAARRMKAR